MQIDLMDALEAAGLTLQALQFVTQRWTDGASREKAFADAGIEDPLTYVHRRIGELAEQHEELRAMLGALAARLDADDARQRVLADACAEYRREPTDERREIFGAAAVAVVLSPMATREIARVWRALRMLDLEDLELLRELRLGGVDERLLERYQAHGDRAANRSLGPRRSPILRAGHLGGANLLAAGCVAIVPHVRKPKTGPGPLPTSLSVTVREPGSIEVEEAVELTPVGELVLRFMRPGAVAEPPESEPDDGADR
ncbi:MAG: hypothetical protein KC619_24075 [Myxococcales bacterium]|nr:hypothetical protein [Myxococcales bacterium]